MKIFSEQKPLSFNFDEKLATEIISPFGFREYDARWEYPDDVNQKGLEIFNEKNIDIKTVFAPNRTYDLSTLKALKNCGIFQIIDGYALTTFEIDQIKFIPQLFHNFYTLPFGVQSTEIHIHNWSESDFQTVKNFIEKNQKKIINLDYALSTNCNNSFINILSHLIKFFSFNKFFNSPFSYISLTISHPPINSLLT